MAETASNTTVASGADQLIQVRVPLDDAAEALAQQDANGRTPIVVLTKWQHRIRNGKGTITVVVPRRPALAGVDPYRKLIERERDDNLATVALPAP